MLLGVMRVRIMTWDEGKMTPRLREPACVEKSKTWSITQHSTEEGLWLGPKSRGTAVSLMILGS